jgi:hypothetical protein
MVGGAADVSTGQTILDLLEQRDALINLIGRTDLPALAGVLSRSRGLVTNDSGAMHLAAAAGVSVTAVFGPTDDTATRPMGDAHGARASVWCRPACCAMPADHDCMRGIGGGGARRRTANPVRPAVFRPRRHHDRRCRLPRSDRSRSRSTRGRSRHPRANRAGLAVVS